MCFIVNFFFIQVGRFLSADITIEYVFIVLYNVYKMQL